MFCICQLSQGNLRPDPAVVGDLAPINGHLLPVFQHGDKKPGSKAFFCPLRRGPVGQVDQLLRADLQACFFPGFANGRILRRCVIVTIRRVILFIDLATGKYPHTAHVLDCLVTLHQQGFQPVIPVAHQHHGSRRVHRFNGITHFQHGWSLTRVITGLQRQIRGQSTPTAGHYNRQHCRCNVAQGKKRLIVSITQAGRSLP